ncbi:hypothetical protein ACROYT_G028280 [Oculina patagonica]
MSKVVFMGLLLSKHGVKPTEEKVRAVAEASQPQTPSEVRSFLGLVGFSARFIPILQQLLIPLEDLQELFLWGKDQENSFQKLKSQVSIATVLAYFDKDAPTRVIAEFSSVGLRAVLVQEKNGESRAVCYASQQEVSSDVKNAQKSKLSQENMSGLAPRVYYASKLFGLGYRSLNPEIPQVRKVETESNIMSNARESFGKRRFKRETTAPKNVQHELKVYNSLQITWDSPALFCHLITNYKTER